MSELEARKQAEINLSVAQYMLLDAAEYAVKTGSITQDLIDRVNETRAAMYAKNKSLEMWLKSFEPKEVR
jgi:hypothetical protein